MFGTSNDNSQPQGGPVTHPTDNNHSINDDIPAAPPEPQAQQSTGADSVFLASSSDDPFGTTPIIDDPSAAADPQATQPPVNQQQSHPEPQPAPQSHGSDDLIGIKQQALQELSPLVQHLNQNAEEKFKTTMMMIQASDDQSLVPEAFESAKQIKDDKARAQALLDIINEINYFTQNRDE